ncbi:MAG: GMC family oxidoreductase [Deltaproteobacteria bacterium]|nr:GMC family oxidoreductase [Deltaproteobacteria bacterium]
MTKREEFDVCVIGTGAGGGVMIHELTAAGFKVVALERGKHYTTANFTDDELGNLIRRSSLAPHQLESYRPVPETPGRAGRFNNLAHCVGGSSVHWSAASWRYRPDEFKVLSSEGPVAGANLADWPIDYEELEPYYGRAERAYGVAGQGGSNPFEPARSSNYPNPPHPFRSASYVIERGAKKMGYHPFPLPLAINSKPYGNRAPCLNSGQCANYGCVVNAKASSLSVHIPPALATGRLDLRPESFVNEIRVDETGRVRSVSYLTATGEQREVFAKRFVLSAGAVGSAHLLKLSTSGAFPQGLANGSGQLGRNLTYHITAIVGFWTDELSHGILGQTGQVAIDDLHASDSKRGFIRGGMIMENGEANPIYYAMNGVSQGISAGTRTWGKPLKDYLRKFRHAASLLAIGEDLPREENGIDVDPHIKDHLGIPVPRITHSNHPNDIALHHYYEDKMIEIAQAAGAKDTWKIRLPGFSDLEKGRSQEGSYHLHGTCRMGEDPSKSVLDRWCRAHDVPNLWVVDGSCFPTAGGYNPTMTLVANAYRVAEKMIEDAKRLEPV